MAGSSNNDDRNVFVGNIGDSRTKPSGKVKLDSSRNACKSDKAASPVFILTSYIVTAIMAARQQVTTPMRKRKVNRDMSPDLLPRSHPRSTFKATMRQTNDPRDGLLPYIQKPEEFSASRIVEFDSNWVLVKDLYPKATVHFLLLPRDSNFYTQHPCQALKDEAFLAEAKNAAEKARAIAASELRRLLGSYSKSEQPRLEAMDADDVPDELPEGRIWEEDVKVGIHACPSMNHMHIHIISRDSHSDRLSTGSTTRASTHPSSSIWTNFRSPKRTSDGQLKRKST